ncbi:hypothetical protein AMJ44_12780 [candidate division WOR-1 bacterium DG_54_3]|uniref:Peptidase C14 caspase domain-containing protein n=1 Tax=candidate division WOR-1 bacterium DG_54_3 TaxID=1703775 RepID=A0A0S7XPQ7_UNCSA|nr:MAG: hypothetical protein AMJ44_12780 [candidate division WOR-1 bacterium DG_54_3]
MKKIRLFLSIIFILCLSKQTFGQDKEKFVWEQKWSIGPSRISIFDLGGFIGTNKDFRYNLLTTRLYYANLGVLTIFTDQLFPYRFAALWKSSERSVLYWGTFGGYLPLYAREYYLFGVNLNFYLFPWRPVLDNPIDFDPPKSFPTKERFPRLAELSLGFDTVCFSAAIGYRFQLGRWELKTFDPNILNYSTRKLRRFDGFYVEASIGLMAAVSSYESKKIRIPDPGVEMTISDSLIVSGEQKVIDLYIKTTGKVNKKHPQNLKLKLNAGTDARNEISFPDSLLIPELPKTNKTQIIHMSIEAAPHITERHTVKVTITGITDYGYTTTAMFNIAIIPKEPPVLQVITQFIDPNKNGLLDVDEDGELEIKIRNLGKVVANNLEINIELKDSAQFAGLLEYEHKLTVDNIKPNVWVSLNTLIKAKRGIPDAKLKFKIDIREGNTGKIFTDALSISTQAFKRPSLQISKINITEVYGDSDQKIENNETIEAKVLITNSGLGVAQDVEALLAIGDRDISFFGEQKHVFGDIEPGQSKSLTFSFIVPNFYSGGEELPINIDLTETWGEFGLSQNLGLTLYKDKSQEETERGIIPYTVKQKLSGESNRWLSNSRSVFVVIGINNYKHTKKLDYAVSDAAAICTLLTERTNFKRYAELYDDQATKKGILSVIDRLTSDGSIDRVIFYFAGHGKTLEGEEEVGFFLPVDGDPDSLFQTAISMKEVAEWAKGLKAKHALFIFDACFSGIISYGERTVNYYLDFLCRNKGRHVITAGTKNDTAREPSDLKHGALTYFLLQALRGKADTSDPKSVITLPELEVYLSDKVANYTKGKQHPEVKSLSEEKGQLFIELKNH